MKASEKLVELVLSLNPKSLTEDGASVEVGAGMLKQMQGLAQKAVDDGEVEYKCQNPAR